jgi:quercetin dioxygenase-like cupin family protein
MVKLDREGWLHFLQGSEPRQAALKSFFYCDDQLRCGEFKLPAGRDTQPETEPYEKVLYVTTGELVLAITGTTDVLKAGAGDVLFVPPMVEHSFMAFGSTGASAIFGLA